MYLPDKLLAARHSGYMKMQKFGDAILRSPILREHPQAEILVSDMGELYRRYTRNRTN